MKDRIGALVPATADVISEPGDIAEPNPRLLFIEPTVAAQTVPQEEERIFGPFAGAAHHRLAACSKACRARDRADVLETGGEVRRHGSGVLRREVGFEQLQLSVDRKALGDSALHQPCVLADRVAHARGLRISGA